MQTPTVQASIKVSLLVVLADQVSQKPKSLSLCMFCVNVPSACTKVSLICVKRVPQLQWWLLAMDVGWVDEQGSQQ